MGQREGVLDVMTRRMGKSWPKDKVWGGMAKLFVGRRDKGALGMMTKWGGGRQMKSTFLGRMSSSLWVVNELRKT